MKVEYPASGKMILFWSIIVYCLWGCSGKEEIVSLEKEEEVAAKKITLLLTPEVKVDSAQVFFFRPIGNRDTLLWHQVIHDLEYLVPHPFLFELPAGRYEVWIFGNVPTECMVAKPPYSHNDIYFDYNKGYKPSAVYYGTSRINVGVDTVTVSGLILLSSFIKLTVREVPDGVQRIIIKILNTSAGLSLAGGYLKQPMEPPLSHTLYDLQPDSTYLATFYCFPGVGQNEKSTLEVNCLDEAGNITYSGTSAPFQARPGYSWDIACSFGRGAARTKGLTFPGKIYFKMEKNEIYVCHL